MKKAFLFLTAICFTMTITMSSCTKERMALDLLYGIWRLDQERDSDGDVIELPSSVTSREELVTFFRCSDKENESCTGTTKTTTTSVIGGSTVTTISSDVFSYRVFQKTQLVIDGQAFEIDELKKKDLVIHPVSTPLATRTYSKQ
jgi:hypothetical protein